MQQHPFVTRVKVQVRAVARTEGYLRLVAFLIDGSERHVRESVRRQLRSRDYAYHYQGRQGGLIFRYDNAPHQPHMRAPRDHKHEPGQVRPLADAAPDLADILAEISRRFRR